MVILGPQIYRFGLKDLGLVYGDDIYKYLVQSMEDDIL
jgi:hypothetical protein